MIPKRRMIPFVMYVLFGVALYVMGMMEIVDEFWSGVGSAFLIIGILRLVRIYRFRNDEAYREKVEVETKDERNQFIRNKAWAWAGYLFVLTAAVCTIAFKLLGFLKERYPKQLMERFKLDEEILQGETLAIMDQIGKNRGCLLKGGRVDYSKVSKGVILD